MAERILIVDDDPWILRMVSTLLEKRGYGIFTANDGEEGLRRAEEALIGRLLEDLAREDLGLLPLVGVRRQLFGHPVAHRLAEDFVRLFEESS